MGLSTLILYLVGNRNAILTVASSRHSLWLGLLFVLSAGFAREYDGEDLLHEPWHLLLPLAASLATSLILFAVIWIVFHGWRNLPFTSKNIGTFIALYWMTAPLAWVYAIPVEEFLSTADATRANLWLLGLVAAWRVVLIIRVICVVYGFHPVRVTFAVLLFADSVLLYLMQFLEAPVLQMMGGVRLTESEQILQSTKFLVTGVSILVWPIVAVGTVVVIFLNYDMQKPKTEPGAEQTVVRPTAWALAVLSLAIWAVILPFTQPQQQRRRQIERQFQAGQLPEALQTMSALPRSAYPRHWDPPPRAPYVGSQPAVVDVVEAMTKLEPTASDWVQDLYWEKFVRHFARYFYHWDDLSNDHFSRILALLEKAPLDDEFFDDHSNQLHAQLIASSPRTPEMKERLKKLLEAHQRYDADAVARIEKWRAPEAKPALEEPQPVAKPLAPQS